VRFVLLLGEMAAVGLGAYLVYGIVRTVSGPRPAALPVGGRWQVHHYAEGGQTVVTVARLTPAGEVVEQHVVSRIADSDPDWSRKFLQARQEAEERAFHLNGPSE
jgi:pyridoxamine 5'-phosphate oxidase family protein